MGLLNLIGDQARFKWLANHIHLHKLEARVSDYQRQELERRQKIIEPADKLHESLEDTGVKIKGKQEL